MVILHGEKFKLMPMKNMENDNQEGDLNKAEEPSSGYSNSLNNDKRIIISSLKDQEEDSYWHWLSLTPIQRLEEHYILITNFYRDEIEENKRERVKRIIFDS